MKGNRFASPVVPKITVGQCDLMMKTGWEHDGNSNPHLSSKEKKIIYKQGKEEIMSFKKSLRQERAQSKKQEEQFSPKLESHIPSPHITKILKKKESR